VKPASRPLVPVRALLLLILLLLGLLGGAATAHAVDIVPIYTGALPMYSVDVSDADVAYADNSNAWVKDMATGKVTQVASGEFGAFTQITHDRIMWQTMNTYYTASYRRAKLRDEGTVQNLPARPVCVLDGEYIAYIESYEQGTAVVDTIGGDRVADLGSNIFSCELAYPWAIWSDQSAVWARDLSTSAPPVQIWGWKGQSPASDGTTVAWQYEWPGNSRILARTLPDGPVITVRESSWAGTVVVEGDWIAWTGGTSGGMSLIYAYHIPTAQTVQVTPSAAFRDGLHISNSWLVWLESSVYGNGGNVRGCRLTDLLAELPAPVALRPTSATLPGGGVRLAFQDTVTAGESNASVGPGRPAPAGYHLLPGTNWDITTQSRTSGYTDITVPYDPATLGGAAESSARLFVWKDGAWIDVTTSVDTAANTVTGRTYYLSQVAVARPRLPQETTSVYRFYNKAAGTHFYTASPDERDAVMAKWPTIFNFDGLSYAYDTTKATQPLYRFYNKKNGGHFYTASADEANHVLATWPDVFTFDGPAYNVSTGPVPGLTVFRFYNKKNGSHFFTASAEERDIVMSRWPDVYTFEGPAFYLPQ
jgi:hypothetical protein